MPRSASFVLTLVVGALMVLLSAPAGPQPPPGASMPMGSEMGGMGGMGGMGMGMPGMPGAPGRGAAAGPLRDTPMPEELRMSYEEFLGLHPDQASVTIPEEYQRKELSETQWKQVMRIFRGAIVGPAERGRIGTSLRRQASKEIAGKMAEMQVMRDLHEEAVDEAFWYEVSWPRVTTNANNPGSVTVYVDVVERVRPQFSDRVLARLEPFSGYDFDRQPFTVITRQGNFFRRHQLMLSSEAVAYWPGLWSGDQIELRVYDKDGRSVVTVPPMSAGHSGSTILDIVNPPEIWTGSAVGTARPLIHNDAARYTHIPEYHLWRRQDGSLIKLDGTEGWLHTFTFSVSISNLGDIDHMEARLVAGEPGAAAGAGGMGGMPGGMMEMMGPGMGGSMMPEMGPSGMMGAPPGMM